MKSNHRGSAAAFLGVLCCLPLCDGKQGTWLRKTSSQIPQIQKVNINAPPKKSSLECSVQFAVGQAEVNKDADFAEEPQEILHCLLDKPDDYGNVLYEVKGLEKHEFNHIRDSVSSGESRRFEFQQVTKSHGMPMHSNIFTGEATPATSQSIHVSKSDGNHKFQAVEISNGRGNKKGEKNGHRKLAEHTKGNYTVLVVRTKAADAETSCSMNDCRVKTFGGIDDNGVLDDMNMKSQIDDCSYGKLKFLAPNDDPSYPAVQGGVVTVELSQNVTGVSHGTVLDWLLQATPTFAGDLGNYDYVMFFMPNGVDMGGAAAFGYVPGKYTWYRDGYSTGTGVQLHELGHNLGMGHSGEEGAAYGDSTCYMGYGGFDTKMCYNAAKSWYLGWYSDLHFEFDPLDVSSPSKLYHLVGLSDYDEAVSAGTQGTYGVVLRIETYESTSLFLTYNRKEKMNADTKEFEDKVTIVRSNGPSQSWVEAALGPGQKYFTPIVAGTGMSLEIIVCERVFDSPDYAVVSVHMTGDQPLCTPQPPVPSWDSYSGSLADGLVGYFPFDSNVLDFSGRGNHGNSFGNPSLASGGAAIGDGYLSLDGIEDFVELPNSVDFDFGSGDFTITFWYRVSGDQSGDPAIIGNKDWSAGLNPGWVVSSNYGPGSNGDDIAINLSDGTTRSDTSKSVDVNFGSFHFVAIRIKRGNTMSIVRSAGGSYIVQEDSISSLSGSLSTGLPIRIGTSHVYSLFTKMDMDDLGIWRRALSSEEVDAIFSAGKRYGKNILEAFDPPPTPPVDTIPDSIIANYDFESNLVDSSQNSLHGEQQGGGGISYQMTSEGYHLSFSNEDSQASYVTLPQSDLLQFGPTSNFTVAFWHRTSADFSQLAYSDPSIMSNKNWWSGSNPGWTIGVGGNGRLEWNAGDGTGSRCDYDGPGGAMNDGNWHHVAFTMMKGSTGEVAIYLDGKRVATKSCTLGTLATEFPIHIGTSPSYPAFYTGDLDQVLIYGSYLSHANILSLYSNGRQVSPAISPTKNPTASPTPTISPTKNPTQSPTKNPTLHPTISPTNNPTMPPTASPTKNPSKSPTASPTKNPSVSPTISPTKNPTQSPTKNPTLPPSVSPVSIAPTTSPTQSPSASPVLTQLACPGGNPGSCGCSEVKQADYRGDISVTQSGIECQAWNSQTPHSHTRTPENYPNSGLDSNFCRNPDGEPRAWCYTVGSTRWDYCDVPECPACSAADPTTCGCSEVKQADYRGTISVTVDGEECQAWNSQTPHSHTRTPENYPDSGLDSNYCRNPDGEPSTWCYTTGSRRWNYCAVPTC